MIEFSKEPWNLKYFTHEVWTGNSQELLRTVYHLLIQIEDKIKEKTLNQREMKKVKRKLQI